MTTAGPSIPGKPERFTTSTYHKMYLALAQLVKALNAMTLLMAYQLLEEMGCQLDMGIANPTLWEEFFLSSSRFQDFNGFGI